jgi:hypothetical protein
MLRDKSRVCCFKLVDIIVDALCVIIFYVIQSKMAKFVPKVLSEEYIWYFSRASGDNKIVDK